MDQIVDLAAEGSGELEPAALSWGIGVAALVMNRRESTDRGVRLGVSPRGLVDRRVSELKIASRDGTPGAVLMGTASHDTTLGECDMQISGDFAGYALHYVER